MHFPESSRYERTGKNFPKKNICSSPSLLYFILNIFNLFFFLGQRFQKPAGNTKKAGKFSRDEMDEEFQIEWADGSGGGNSGTSSYGHQIICESHSDDLIEENNDIEEGEEYLVGEEIIPSTEIITMSNSLDQIAAENLIYMAQDGSVTVMGDLIEEQVDQVDNADYNEQQYFECQVTEEVITDDWVQQQGEDRFLSFIIASKDKNLNVY